jgi:hypothetical protein
MSSMRRVVENGRTLFDILPRIRTRALGTRKVRQEQGNARAQQLHRGNTQIRQRSHITKGESIKMYPTCYAITVQDTQPVKTPLTPLTTSPSLTATHHRHSPLIHEPCNVGRAREFNASTSPK